MAAAKGNQYAAKERRFVAMLQRVLDQGDGDSLRRVAAKLIEQAEAGEGWAIKELADRLDGKPVQQVDMGGSLDLTKTYRDLSDEVLAQIVAEAVPHRTNGTSIQ